MMFSRIDTNGLRIRKRNSRLWIIVIGIFVMMFVFSFLIQKYRVNKDAEAASLAGFDPGYIISDWQMSNYNSMSETDIQAFLSSKNSCGNTSYDYYLALSTNQNYRWHFENGHFICLSEERFGDGETIGYGDTAAHIIWQAAQDYRINPQVLLVLLQKETGLITDPIPNNGDYRKATGYGCPDTAPCSSQYYGFKNQIRKAAALFRTVLDGGWTNYPLGNNYVQYNPNPGCGGSVINIRSLATSALYRYTPYQPNQGALDAGYGTAYCGAYGNRNFYLYFQDWFGGVNTEGAILAPGDIRAIQGERAITISWNEPSNAWLYGDISYEVVLADTNKKELKVVVDGTNRDYTFSGLGEGAYVAASVKAITKSGSNFGRITFNYVFGRAPDAPTDLSVALDDGGIKVSWKKPIDTGGLDIIKYEVVIADVDRKEYLIETDGSQESAVFYGLPFNEFFAASVKAFNEVGSRFERIVFNLKNYIDLSNDYSIYDGFMDMPSDEISRDAVSWAVHNGITDKNPYFNGENSLTRRQAVVMFWRLAGQPESGYYNGFADMPSDEISRRAVSWAVNNAITDKNLYFNGEMPLSRRQATVMLWRLIGQPATSIYNGFADMPSDEISRSAVSWAANEGIVDKNARLNGENNVTRRQFIVLLKRFYGLL